MDRLFPRDWYWLADDGRLYSSRHQRLVTDNNGGYIDWKAEGRIPTRWPEDDAAAQTDASLLDVVSAYNLVIGESSLDVARRHRITALSADCGNAITGGFQSDALGSVHTYPSDMKDQLNLMGSVTDSIVPDLPNGWETPFWVLDNQGSWSFKMHNAGQIQQAGRDGKAHVVECQSTLEGLTALVLAADTTDDVEAVVWPVA